MLANKIKPEIEHLEMKNATISESYDKNRNLDSIEDTKPGSFVWLCATATAIGGSLFGCKSTSAHFITPRHR